MIFAVIKNGVVANVIMASQSFVDQYYLGAVRIDTLTPKPGIGWIYAGGKFSPKG